MWITLCSADWSAEWKTFTGVRLRSGYCLRSTLFIFADRSPATWCIHSHCEFITFCLSLRSDFLGFRCAHAYHTYGLRLVCALPTFIKIFVVLGSGRKPMHGRKKQNIQLIQNRINKSSTLVPEQRTFSIGAERKFKFPNASMSPLSTFLRFRSRTTPYSVCYSSGHGSISVRDISFFWLPAFGKSHKKKSVAFVQRTAVHTYYYVWSFHFGFDFSCSLRPSFFLSIHFVFIWMLWRFVCIFCLLVLADHE